MTSEIEETEFNHVLDLLPTLIKQHRTAISTNSLPITANLASPPTLPTLPTAGLGLEQTFQHLQSSILPHLAQAHSGPRYYGFVTGGVTPAALLADYLVSTYDQNVQVHLPQSISTDVETRTVGMVCELLALREFNGTITTGATAGNILGLACGREKVCGTLLVWVKTESAGGVRGQNIWVLSAGAHSSVSKACSIAGIGREFLKDMTSSLHASAFDLLQLEMTLRDDVSDNGGAIVVATFGEVNSGAFTPNIAEISRLCKQYNAWLHIDAAFGILARIHPNKRTLAAGLELADSISFDGHKFFNVPYDCGVFLTRNMSVLASVCGNTGAVYLSPGIDVAAGQHSPLNVGLENSRRFRALPLYASLLSLGKEGYVDIVVRCCRFAETLGKELDRSAKFRLLLPVEFNIVLFQAVGYESVERNDRVRDAVNGTGKMYLSGTTWKGEGALRIAVCNYLTPSDAAVEASIILSILTSVLPLP